MAGFPLHFVLDHLRRLHVVANTTERSDRDLLRTFVVNHDQDAFAAVVTRHAPLVWGVCRRVLRHSQDAEDVFQATFLILARRAGAIRWQSSVGGWLHTVAHRLAVRARKQAEQRRIHERAPRRNYSGDSSLRELAAVVDEELRCLPAKYRDPLLLHYLDGATAEAGARQLGLSRGTFYNRLARGRELLRHRLIRQGVSLTAPLLAASLTCETEAAFRTLIPATIQAVTTNAPQHVVALASEGFGDPILVKLKIGLALGLLLGMAAGGVVMLSPRAPTEPPTHVAQRTDPPKAEEKSAQRVDRYGDLLPPGAIARLGTLRFRVDAWIEALAFAPDGKAIAVQGDTGIWLLDMASGKQIRRVDHAGVLSPGIAFSPDGKQLIAACQFGEKDPVQPVIHIRRAVRVWETASGRKLMESALADARWVGFSDDGQPLAAYVAKGEMRLRNVATGRERRFPAKDLPDPVQAVICSCTVAENILAASDQNLRIHVWDLTNGKELYLLKTTGQYVRSLALSPNGRWLASHTQDASGAYTVRVWDTATGEAVNRIPTDQKHIQRVFFSPDGKALATVGWDEVHFWDVATGRKRGRIRGGGGYYGGACLSSPDGKTLATTEAYSGVIHLWDVASGTKKPAPEGHTNRPGRPSFSPDGKRVATAGGMDGATFFWDPVTGEPLLRMHQDGESDCLFSADGRTLYCCNGDKLCFHDAATGRELHSLRVEDPEHPKARQAELRLFLADDRDRLIVFSSGGDRERLVAGWDAAKRKQLFRRRRAVTFQWRSAVSPDARTLAGADSGGTEGKGDLLGGGPMYLEDLASGERLLTFPSFEGQRWPLVISPDGRLMVSYNHPLTPGKQESTLRLWEVLSASEVMKWPSSNGNDTAAFSPDGRLLAMTAPAQTIRLWDLNRGKELRRFKSFDSQVTSLAFSPDGRQLISGLSNSTLLVWDVGAVPLDHGEKLGAEVAAKAWADLGSPDAPRAFRARGELESAPEKAMALLRKHLHPALPADPRRLRRLLTDLESEQFTVREKAQEELAKLGDLAEAALRKTLNTKPTLEVRRHVQAMLEHLRGPVTRPELLQSLRAVAVLEDIGTPETRQLLEKLTKGAPEARLTREAKASLRRLERRSGSK